MIHKSKYFKTKDNMVGVDTKVWADGSFSVVLECRRANGAMYRQHWTPPARKCKLITELDKLMVISSLISHMRLVAGKEL